MRNSVRYSVYMHISCDPATAFDHIYQADLMARWYGGTTFRVKQLNFSVHRIGQQQLIRIVPLFFWFETEVTDVSPGRYIKGSLSGMMSGTWEWAVIPKKNGVKVIHELHAKGTSIFSHLVVRTALKIGDYLYCRMALSKLKRILERMPAESRKRTVS